ncbi:hypothetical protein HNQ93_001217 [Hymenobacter luteus]|uniref:Uncharacterized protein n=2 Tax=Hymenobacter TaxID=89966 RepID=A0A7W9WBI3_9BACT|nr:MULTISPECIES: hypothetical protein [Hymenobacter]MBB4601422.1 hypothetical protein [Hymenobacter latericoloratus]MBB6058371.1 hypothetical protein [Hymenobacter luteus]
MKTSLLSRLSLLGLTLALSSTLAQAQTTFYSEAPIIAKSGYWTLETNPRQQDYTIIRFYNDDHSVLYEERLNGICLNPLKNQATHRRMARMLGTALDQVQRLQANSVVATNVLALNRRYTQRAYASLQ